VQSLSELLQNFSPTQLDALRKTLRLKADSADPVRLLQRLNNSDRTRQVFADLEPTEKHVLRYLLSQGGSATEPELMSRFPDAGPAIAKLREHYLVFDDSPAAPDPMLCVPPGICALYSPDACGEIDFSQPDHAAARRLFSGSGPGPRMENRRSGPPGRRFEERLAGRRSS